MWFYQVIVALVVATIGTIVGTVLSLAFGLPMGIIGTWFGQTKDSKPKEIKEVRRF